MSAGPHLAKLSYEAAVRALDVQERSIEQLRARAGVLLATASVTASFLGAQTIQHASGLGVLEVLALVSLAATIASCTYVLLPKQGFVFSLRGVRMFEMLYEIAHDEEAEEVDRRLVYWLEEYWESNQDQIEDLGRYFFAAAVALVLQFSFWSWALADTIHLDAKATPYTQTTAPSGPSTRWAGSSRDPRRSRPADSIALGANNIAR